MIFSWTYISMMTIKNSHKLMVILMKIFERPMRKVFRDGKLKEYVTTLGSKSEIEDSKFYKNDNGKMVCDVLVCFPDEYEKLMSDHNDLQSQITELNETISSQKKTIESLENQLSSIDEDHRKELKELNDEYSAKVDGLNKDLHDKDLEIKETEKEYEEKIGNLKEDNQKEINKLELYDKEYHMKITDHQKEVSGIKDRIVRETIHHNDNLNSLDKNLESLEDNINLIGFIKGRPKSKLKELKESTSELKKDIEAFRYIAQYIESKNDDEVQDVKLKKDG